MNTKSANFDARFRFALLDYRIARLGVTPRLTPATAVVRLSRSLERLEKESAAKRAKAA
ncbi:MAG: hypothetical protein U0166_00760 [Acidobacteriota bacterium]